MQPAILLCRISDAKQDDGYSLDALECEEGSDFQSYAKLYKDIIKDDGITVEVRTSKRNWDNLKQLQDPNSDVDAGFSEDGLGTVEKFPDISSVGSLYYEPIWVFYRGNKIITRFSQFAGTRLAIGFKGGGTNTLAQRILKESGVDEKSATLFEIGHQDAVDALLNKKIDGAIFLATPEEKFIGELAKNPNLHLMSVDQADAITRQFPYLHHLILPHGTFDLKNNIPDRDVDLVSPTATLLVRDSLHPSLVYLLLKAASQVHSDPAIFEKKKEFPVDKDYNFPLAEEAQAYYKSGAPFWQRYLPFWLATLVDRFILLAIPLMALIIPIARLIPRILEWRVKNRIYQRYGELKFLETQIKPDSIQQKYDEHLAKLDEIDVRVSHMKVPLDFSDYFYGLREHIQFVRQRLERLINESKPKP